MSRRFHVTALKVGLVQLDEKQGRHLRNVLRMEAGEEVELFDAEGRRARGKIICTVGEEGVSVEVEKVEEGTRGRVHLTIAAAPPKGPRADWMVEKLAELGVGSYLPLQTARTVVHPEAGKLQRWQRIATEAAKQCQRADVMRILPPQNLAEVAGSKDWETRWCLATEMEGKGAMAEVRGVSGRVIALIGPEGGWTEGELASLQEAGFVAMKLTETILRIDTAAMTLGALVMMEAERGE